MTIYVHNALQSTEEMSLIHWPLKMQLNRMIINYLIYKNNLKKRNNFEKINKQIN